MGVKGKVSIGFLLIGMLFLTSCSIGKKAVLTYDGVFELEVGKTKLAEVLGAGFEDRYPHVAKPQLDGRSWDYFYVVKDNLTYGDFYVANRSSGKVDFQEGVVFRVKIDYDDSEYAAGEILINGVDYEGYTRDQIKEAMSWARLDLDADSFLSYVDGRFEYTFWFEEGSEIVSSVSIDDGTDWKP